MTSPFWWHASSDGKPGWRKWLRGRFWLHRRSKDRRARFTCFTLEWTIPCGHFGWSITLGGGDSGRNLGFTFAIPFLCTLYLTIEHAFAKELFEWDFDRGHDRQIGCYFHAWALRYHVWVGSMASWSRSYPSWCRWWRQGAIHFDDLLLGKMRCHVETVREGMPITVQMAEGNYRGTASFKVYTRKRPRWFARVEHSTEVNIPKGIPFAGKGENAWDCGDDGLFGYGCAGHSVHAAAIRGAEIVMESRRRYGRPSDQAIREALA